MNAYDLISSVVGAAFLFLGTLVTVKNRPSSPEVEKAVEAARDPGADALRIALDLQARLTKVEERNAELIEENKGLMRVLRGTLRMLRKVPPLAHAEIVAYVLTELPHLGEDGDE